MKIKLNEHNTLVLNTTLPILLILILFFVNALYFEIYYVEHFIELVKIIFFFAFLVFTYEFIKTKVKKIKVLKLNIYKIGVLNLISVLLFLILNSIKSETIFETYIRYENINQYEKSLNKYIIPYKFKKLYKINPKEKYIYKNGNYIFEVKVGRSIFGYKVVEKRKFKGL